MYRAAYFTETDREKIIEFINRYPFGLLAGMGETYPVATQIPLAVEEKDGKILLHGHLMKKTDHHLAFEKNNHVLAVFSGPQCYISASWYTHPAGASTWNYMTVHASGKMRFTDDAGTIAALKAITERFEGTDTPASFDKLNDDYIQSMVKAVVGFTIEADHIEAVFKLSQNRDEASKMQIIQALKKRGDDNSAGIAAEMEKRV